MPLATLKEILDQAQAEKRAVPMFNVIGVEYAEAIVLGAEELGLPVMLGMPFLDWHIPANISNFLIDLAGRVSVPVALHLDHGRDFAGVMRALRLGFSSVMYDGSALPFEENIKNTAEIVKISHAMGVSVEGEMGFLGFEKHVEVKQDNLTKPEEAKEFVERTGVDALAVAIGNAHGHYTGTPKIEMDRLRAIRSVVDVPLVLHGGSGIPNDVLKQSIAEGICKVNIFTDMNDFTADFVKRSMDEGMSWAMICKNMTVELRKYVVSVMRVLARLD
ncbi:MAG: class II fructose-bisphosphate aldolase [Oscillospiraceae bacterium]|nr:class II fructose-bisphosphate aldolase [Oscillospiraceae bacterium]